MKSSFTRGLLPFLLLSGAAISVPAAVAIAQHSGATSGVLLDYRDMGVKPGDDFDAFANGGWRKATDIPSDRSSIGVSYEVFLKAEQRNADLIRQAGAGNPAPGTPQRMIADYYAAYMDTAGIERRGLAPLQPRLAAIEAIDSKASLARALGSTLRADVDPLNATNFQTENLFGLWVAQALDNPNRNTPYLLQGGLGMPDREYYVSRDDDMVRLHSAYRAYVEDVLKLSGFRNADDRARAIVALEDRIAAAHADRTASQDVHAAKTWSRAALKAQAPGLDWDAFLTSAGLQRQTSFIAWHPGAISGISALVGNEDLATWKDWLAFHTISQYAPYLPRAFDDRRFDFYGKTLQGTPQQRDRWKRGIANVNTDLGDAVGKIYVARYFPASSKREVQAMVTNILAAFNRRVDALTWMAPRTKAKAKAKIRTLRVGVGYPETWRTYSGVGIRADDPFGNAWRAREYEYRHQVAKLGRPVDRNEWWMTPQTVNAVNLPLQNALNFPAAILEAPYFNPSADPAANYGAIGAVIGHEISHSFDNTGAEFDEYGRLTNWWTPADLEHFREASRRLIAQYDSYEPLPGLHLKGELELSENIADVAGLAAAYDAYRMSLRGRPAPVIDGLTGDQRFFLAFAQAWRGKIREAALRQRIITDGHAPGAQRALTVRNIDGWYPAYGVKPGDKLYLAPAERVRIW